MPDVVFDFNVTTQDRYEIRYFVAGCPVTVDNRPLVHWIKTNTATKISAMKILLSMDDHFPDKLLQAAARILMSVGNTTIAEVR